MLYCKLISRIDGGKILKNIKKTPIPLRLLMCSVQRES